MKRPIPTAKFYCRACQHEWFIKGRYDADGRFEPSQPILEPDDLRVLLDCPECGDRAYSCDPELEVVL